MDFLYNLTKGEDKLYNFLGHSSIDIEKHLNADHMTKYKDIFLGLTQKYYFSLSDLDSFSNKYSTLLRDNFRIMAAGPQTEDVIQGKVCSHNLTSVLKLYLPLLEVPDNHVVIVDEKAGADGVTTGIVSGLDIAVVVSEPSLHSVKTAKQIIELLARYEIPYVVVGNKISSSEDREYILKAMESEHIFFLPQSSQVKINPGNLDIVLKKDIEALVQYLIKNTTNLRYERTLKKFNS
jgi:CO dehydrogenase nickel-insertion accessory protein CooC1